MWWYRGSEEREALEQLGHLIAVVHVDGFLMFGSTPAFTDTVRELMCPKGPESLAAIGKRPLKEP